MANRLIAMRLVQRLGLVFETQERKNTNRDFPLSISRIIARTTLVERNPSPGGVSYILCSLIKNPEEEDPLRSTWYKLFKGGSSSSGFWIRKHNKWEILPRGGVLSIKSYAFSDFREGCGVAVLQTNKQTNKLQVRFLSPPPLPIYKYTTLIPLSS